MTATHDERFEAAAAAYLLGALDADEVAAFEAHAEDCPACRAELRDLKGAADAIPHGVSQHRVPPALEDRIMAVVRSEAALLHATSPDADVVPAPAATAPARGGRWSRWLGRPAFALAATLFVLAVGVLGGATLLGGPDTRTVQAASAPAGASVELIMRADSDHSTLKAANLPDAGDGRVYQVWLRSGADEPVPTNALFSVSARGGMASVDVPGDLSKVDHVLVTSEPDGGSQAPSTPPVIAVSTT